VVDSNDRDRIVEARDELHRMLSEVSHAVMHPFEFGCGVNTEEDVGVDPIWHFRSVLVVYNWQMSSECSCGLSKICTYLCLHQMLMTSLWSSAS